MVRIRRLPPYADSTCDVRCPWSPMAWWWNWRCGLPIAWPCPAARLERGCRLVHQFCNFPRLFSSLSEIPSDWGKVRDRGWTWDALPPVGFLPNGSRSLGAAGHGQAMGRPHRRFPPPSHGRPWASHVARTIGVRRQAPDAYHLCCSARRRQGYGKVSAARLQQGRRGRRCPCDSGFSRRTRVHKREPSAPRKHGKVTGTPQHGDHSDHVWGEDAGPAIPAAARAPARASGAAITEADRQVLAQSKAENALPVPSEHGGSAGGYTTRGCCLSVVASRNSG